MTKIQSFLTNRMIKKKPVTGSHTHERKRQKYPALPELKISVLACLNLSF